MKINRPASPLSGGAEPLEPLDPRDLQRAIKSKSFTAALSQLEQQVGGTNQIASPTQTALKQIADRSDFSTSEGMLAAVRDSARFMVESRLGDVYRKTPEGKQIVENLSDYVASDPLLQSKLTRILKRIKDQ